MLQNRMASGSGAISNTAMGLLPFAVGIVLASLLYFVLPLVLTGRAGPYYSRIVTDIGIAIILAVSLNIVNGMTGQFSIGHAGFMTLGAYTSAFITYYGSMCLWGSTGCPRWISGKW